MGKKDPNLFNLLTGKLNSAQRLPWSWRASCALWRQAMRETGKDDVKWYSRINSQDSVYSPWKILVLFIPKEPGLLLSFPVPGATITLIPWHRAWIAACPVHLGTTVGRRTWQLPQASVMQVSLNLFGCCIAQHLGAVCLGGWCLYPAAFATAFPVC